MPRVSDCMNEAEQLRKRARVYERLRCSLVQNFEIGNGPNQISIELFNSVAEELVLRANEAKQQEEAVMARQVR